MPTREAKSDGDAGGRRTSGKTRLERAEARLVEATEQRRARMKRLYGELPFPRVWGYKLHTRAQRRRYYRNWKERQTPESWDEYLAKKRAQRYARKMRHLQQRWGESQKRRAQRRSEREELWEKLGLATMLSREEEALEPRQLPEPRPRRFRPGRVKMDPEERRLRYNAARRSKRAALREPRPPPEYKPPTLKFCYCVQCAIRQRAGTTMPYRCSVFRCAAKFADLVALCEHQLDAHGLVIPHSRRIIAELNHQERASVPYPPATVYAGQQFLNPNVRPTAWTSMERVATENQTLLDKLKDFYTEKKAQELVWKSFQAGYARIQQGGGLAELQRQYCVALEHYNSSLTFPVATRSFQDGMPAVAPGRNWLTSTEREDVIRAKALRFGNADSDDESDDEIVLMDTDSNVTPSFTPARASSDADEDAGTDANALAAAELDIELEPRDGNGCKLTAEQASSANENAASKSAPAATTDADVATATQLI